MREIARARGGKCLSTEYKNNHIKLRWRCKLGHEWEAIPNSVAPRAGFKGSWCPICAGRLSKRGMLQQLIDLAVSRNGKLLSKNYRNARAHVRWRCEKGHEWRALPDAVKRGSWCPVCGGKFPLTLAKMRDLAIKFDGKCLSKAYVNSSTRLLWKCADGHEWQAKPDHVIQGHWCPICASGISERICRALLERLAGVAFPKARPQWLINSRGNQMELDGYAPDQKLAFEYQGHQHFNFVSVFHRHDAEFEQRRRDDEHKRRLCRQHGIKLMEIPYHVPHSKLQEHIATVLQRLGLRVVNVGQLSIGELGVWKSGELARMRHIAASSGGKLLSKFYINENTKLKWICKKGHEWETTPHNIKRGSWCPVCGRESQSAKNRAHTIEEMQSLAKAKGGRCLSKQYESCAKKLRWRCKVGHEWSTVPRLVINGHWCPKCARIALRSKAPFGAKSL